MPAHSQISGALTYQSQRALTPGTLVRVPLGRRQTLGIVWGPADQVADEAPVLRDIDAALDELPPLSAAWRELVDFAARYYQRGVGEIALAAMPPSAGTRPTPPTRACWNPSSPAATKSPSRPSSAATGRWCSPSVDG